MRSEECDGLEECLRHEAKVLPTGYSVHGTEVWVDPKADPWVFGYPYRYASSDFDVLYLHRLVVERTIGDMKESGRLSRFRFRGLRRVRLHTVMHTLMEQSAIMVALERLDEAKRVTVLAVAA